MTRWPGSARATGRSGLHGVVLARRGRALAVAVAVTTAGALAAAGCGSSGSGSAGKQVSASAKQTIVFATQGLGAEGTATQAAVKAFEKLHPNIKVQILTLSPTSDVDVVVLTTANETPPKPGKFRYRDVLLEVTFQPWHEYAFIFLTWFPIGTKSIDSKEGQFRVMFRLGT